MGPQEPQHQILFRFEGRDLHHGVPSALESEEDLVLRLLRTHAVLTHPGYFFDFSRESFLVVSLLAREAAFREGIARVLHHFNGYGADGPSPKFEAMRSSSGSADE